MIVVIYIMKYFLQFVLLNKKVWEKIPQYRLRKWSDSNRIFKLMIAINHTRSRPSVTGENGRVWLHESGWPEETSNKGEEWRKTTVLRERHRRNHGARCYWSITGNRSDMPERVALVARRRSYKYESWLARGFDIIWTEIRCRPVSVEPYCSRRSTGTDCGASNCS